MGSAGFLHHRVRPSRHPLARIHAAERLAHRALRTALDFIDRLMESPSSRLLVPGQTYPSTFRSVCETAEVRGNLAFDAQIVASCIEHGVYDLITADRDFARFTAISSQFL